MLIDYIDTIQKSYQNNDNNFIRKKGVISFIACIIFMISPLFSLPFILYGIYKNEKASLFLAALFFGVITYILRPERDLDLSRYYEAYDTISNINFKYFILFLKTENDYLFYCIYYFFSLFGIKFQYVLLILSTTCFYISFWVFDKIIKQSEARISKNQYFIFFILFTLSLPVLALIFASRFSIGYTFFILFIYNKFVNKRHLSYFFLLLAIITHFAYIIYLPFLLIINNIRNKKTLLIVIVLLLFSSMYISIDKIIGIISNILPSLSMKMFLYMEMYEGTYIKILSLILLIPVFLSILFFIINNKYIPLKIMYIFLSTLIVVLLTLPFNMIIYDRFIQIFKPIFVITLVITFYNSELPKRRIFPLKLFCFISFLPFFLYYGYTFYIIYWESFKQLFSLNKILLVSILDTSYSFNDFYK